MRRIISVMLALGLLAAIAYSGTRLWALDEEIYSIQENSGRVVALSTCSYAFRGARMVLLGKVT